mmetsp:Transcript_42580/g.99944  ORF Transcript_42580/g.99944 Transcript_42580/m.99944 type:complete len:258 (+) Transcript_42580:1859-2632(+)
MLSPNPVPPYWRVVMAPSAWTYGWKSLACPAALMPAPVSITTKVRARSVLALFAGIAETLIVMEPDSVNLIAFHAKLDRICCTRTGSPMTVVCLNPSNTLSSVTFLVSAVVRICDITARTTFAMSYSMSSMLSLPSSILLRSSTSFMIFMSCVQHCWVVCTSWSCSSDSSLSSRNAMLPITPLSGFRISWHRNPSCSVLACDAASAATRIVFAITNASRSEMFWHTNTIPVSTVLVIGSRRGDAFTIRSTTPVAAEV